ncbi:MAG: hypothetical protein R3290_01180, partial [Acidimicrobiia bacterium]|nr:hypothetical protein [Acidimicrobiia bacterium]
MGSEGGQRGAINLVVALVVAGLVTAGAGFALGATGVVDLVGSDDPGPATAPVDEITTLACPAGDPIGTLRRGDRVFVVGVDVTGDYAEIRSPDGDGTVWVAVANLIPDEALDGLPIEACTEPILADTAATTTTSSTTTTVPGTTTTSSSTSTTSSSTTTTTTAPSTTTTTAPPSTTTTVAATTTTSTSTTSTTSTSTTSTTSTSTTTTTST